MYIGVYIKRKERRMTQEQVAQKVGMKTDTYSKKENGSYDFTVREGLKIAEFYGCTLDDLFRSDLHETA